MMAKVKSYQPRPTGPRVERCMDNSSKDQFQVHGLRELSPLFYTRTEAECWLKAQLEVMPLSQRPQVRSCLKCQTGFESQGAHNRMCDRCRLAASIGVPVTFSFGAIHGRKRSA